MNLLLVGGGGLSLIAAAGRARLAAIHARLTRRSRRAREPDREGYVDRDGVKLYYEVFGDSRTTLRSCPWGRSSAAGSGRPRSRS